MDTYSLHFCSFLKEYFSGLFLFNYNMTYNITWVDYGWSLVPENILNHG